MAERFYTHDPLQPGEYTLTGAEAHHLHAVRRLGAGETVVLFNGDGNEYPATIVEAGKKSVHIVVGPPRPVQRERPVPLWIASAIPKGDRLDFLVEKLTELGVARFVPLITENSAVRPKAEVAEKYRRMVVEASKQCGRNILMEVEAPATWTTFARRNDLPIRKRILHPGVPDSPPEPEGPCVCAIGPEGGFTAAELAVPGWTPVALGPTVLRVETAAIAAACRYNS